MTLCKIILTFISFIAVACQHDTEAISEKEFRRLMTQLADSWTTQNTDKAVECFTNDAIYMQPPDEQLYIGHEQLRPFFKALKKGTVMKLHNIWFNRKNQTGAAEFTFGNSISKQSVTGVIVIAIEHGRIKEWREYFISGPIDFDEFTSTENKEWKWTIKNYP
jgi:hypothetical protein